MALIYVGGVAAGYYGAASITQSLTSLTGGVGTAPIEGDFVVVVLSHVGEFSASPYFTTSGYTEQVDLLANDIHDTTLVVGTKFMGATPDTEVVLDGSGNSLYGSTVMVHAWRGVDPSTPLDVAITTGTGTSSGIANAPSITPLTAGAQILVIGAAAGTYSSYLQNTGSALSNFLSARNNDTYNVSSAMGSVAWTSGAYDPVAFTLAGADDTAWSWAAATIALRPLAMPEALPGSGSLTITSEAPAMIFASPTMYPDSGVLNIDFYEPSVEQVYVLSPGEGSLALTGEATSTVVYENLYAQPGNFDLALSGQVPSAQVTYNAYPSPGDATLSITAAAPLPVEGYIASPDAGTLTLDESATNAVQNELPSPGEAAATITGQQVTLQRLFSANTGSGALSITGAAPSLLESVSTVMQPAAAALAITGQAPVVDLGSVPIPSATTLTALGAAPALRLDMVCSPGVGIILTNWLWTADGTWTADGELTADGIVIQTAPTVVVSDHAIAQPGAGSAAVTGQAPTVAATAGVWSEPSAGSIAITGQQPTVAQTTSQYPSPNPCTITVDCIEPTPVVGTVIGVPVATVAITSSVPSLVADTNLVISGEAPVIGVAGPGNMVMSVIRLYGALDGGRDVRLKWPEN